MHRQQVGGDAPGLGADSGEELASREARGTDERSLATREAGGRQRWARRAGIDRSSTCWRKAQHKAATLRFTDSLAPTIECISCPFSVSSFHAFIKLLRDKRSSCVVDKTELIPSGVCRLCKAERKRAEPTL